MICGTLISKSAKYIFEMADPSIYQYEQKIDEEIPYVLYVQLKRKSNQIILLLFPIEYCIKSVNIINDVYDYLITIMRTYIYEQLKKIKFLPHCCYFSVYLYII